MDTQIEILFSKARWGDYQKDSGSWAIGIANQQELKEAIKQLIAEECNRAKIQGAAYIYNIVFTSPKDSIYGEVGDGIEKLKRELSTPDPINSGEATHEQ